MRKGRTLLKFGVMVLALALGGTTMWALSKLKKAPAQAEATELSVKAVGMELHPETVRSYLVGYGTARAHRRSTISAEVGGRVVRLNPALENGAWISEGELLLAVDARDYKSRMAQLEAEIDAPRAQIAQLEQQRVTDSRRRDVVEHALELTRNDYERVKKLALEDRVESRQRMEAVELLMAREEEQLVTLEGQIAIYPIQIRQQQAGLEGLQAQLEQARLDLERTEIRAPFAGRVDDKQVEFGQIVAPSAPLLTLIDDTVLELALPLEGGEVARWLDVGPIEAGLHWFTQLPNQQVRVRWSELPGGQAWTGYLDRIERYDEQTRTVTLIARIEGQTHNPGGGEEDFPLLEGMFCEAVIPGRAIDNVFRLPRSAVSHDSKVLTVVDGRLKTQAVRVLRYQGNDALVREGLQPGDRVLTTQPGLVLDGVKVDLTLRNPAAQAADVGPGADLAAHREREPTEAHP